MPATWEIVGGADKGGILVREGQDLKSPATAERLSTGAIVEQIALAGDRLNYRLRTGTGPQEGWISVKISGKALAEKRADEAPAAAAAAPAASSPAASASGPGPADWKSLREAAGKAEPAPSKIKEAAPWVKPVFKPAAQAKVRLVMFTWTGNRGGAGSAHDFKKWEKWLAEESPKDTWEVCKVELPGRGMRVKEPNASSASEVATAVADALGKAGHPPAGTVLFGFSFGAALAYETAVLLAARGAPVLGLVVASAEHPAWEGRTLGSGSGKPTKDMDDASFEDMLRRKGGTDVILKDESMKKMYMPVIRADMVLEEQYGSKAPEHPPLPCPVVAFRGKACPQVSREATEPWLACSALGKEAPSRVEELDTGLKPMPGAAPWLSDWYLCQSDASAQAMAKAIAHDFGPAS